MESQTQVYRRIECKPGVRDGKPCIAGTAIKVQNIVIWTEQGDTPDDIVNGYPHLSLADVHAALVYYYDNQEGIDRDIMNSAQFVTDMELQQRAEDKKRIISDADTLSS